MKRKGGGREGSIQFANVARERERVGRGEVRGRGLSQECEEELVE